MSTTAAPCPLDRPCKPCRTLAQPEVRRGDHQVWRSLRSSFHRDRTAPPTSDSKAVAP